jgi:putative toxin-antitoxin system antitoxin component (TIGR02293 family)
MKKLKPTEYNPAESELNTAEEPVMFYNQVFQPELLMQSAKNFAPHDFSSRLNLVKKGITRQSLNNLMDATGLSLTEMASYMHMSERTLRNYSPDTRLGSEPSERALEIATLYEKGKEVFGNVAAFKDYMDATIPALGFRKPKEFLDTSMGIAFLMDELGRIQHGVLS